MVICLFFNSSTAYVDTSFDEAQFAFGLTRNHVNVFLPTHVVWNPNSQILGTIGMLQLLAMDLIQLETSSWWSTVFHTYRDGTPSSTWLPSHTADPNLSEGLPRHYHSWLPCRSRCHQQTDSQLTIVLLLYHWYKTERGTAQKPIPAELPRRHLILPMLYLQPWRI